MSCLKGVFGTVRCHIEMREDHESNLVKARPFAEDCGSLRAVLDTSNHQPEFLSAHDGGALVAAVEFLVQRFGTLTDPPIPCAAERHQYLTPLKWREHLSH
jgi:hypothetical protein